MKVFTQSTWFGAFLRSVASIALIFVIPTSGLGLQASNRAKGDTASEGGSSHEVMESMLHSLALYILAAEVLGYLEDGTGDTSLLAQKYSSHPGWIPAFGRAMYDPDNRILYVPLGQCMWKIFEGDHGELQFCLLQPTDKDLEDDDRKILTMHLFRLVNDADGRRDTWAAARNALAAESLLYPGPRNASRSSRTSSHSRSPVIRNDKGTGDSL